MKVLFRYHDKITPNGLFDWHMNGYGRLDDFEKKMKLHEFNKVLALLREQRIIEYIRAKSHDPFGAFVYGSVTKGELYNSFFDSNLKFTEFIKDRVRNRERTSKKLKLDVFNGKWSFVISLIALIVSIISLFIKIKTS